MEKLYHIGRDRNKNEFYIIDESVSSSHAQIFLDNNADIFIVDLSSKNGVYVNGEKINSSKNLQNQDKITLGNFSFKKEDLVNAIKIYEKLRKEGNEKNISLVSTITNINKKKSNFKSLNPLMIIIIIMLLGIIGAGLYFLNQQSTIRNIIDNTNPNTDPKEKTTEINNDNPVDKVEVNNKKQSTDVTYDFTCLINQQDELGTSLILDFGDLTRDVQNELLSEVDVSIEDEINEGNNYLNEFRKESNVTTGGREYTKLKKIMNDLVSRLSSPRGFKYEIFLIEEDIENAITIGGKIFFYRGMYEFCKNESEIAALISHEIAHNELGHLIIDIKKNKLASEFGIFGEIALLFESATTMSFNQKQEAEADMFGADLIYASDFNNCSSVILWERFSKSEGTFDQNENLILTHPYSKDRANCIDNHFKNNYEFSCK